MNVFSDVIDMLNDAMGQEGEPVTFTSAAAGVSIPVQMMRGKSQITATGTDGAILQVLTHDWLVSAADLARVTKGTAYTPAKGDSITTLPDSMNPAGQVYELMEPPFSPSDHALRRLRLHTVRTK